MASSKGASTRMLWLLGGAIGLFMLGTSNLFAGKRKAGLQLYKFPAKFPKEWDGRTVKLRVDRRYRLPVPQPEDDTYWTLTFRTDAGEQVYEQEMANGKGAVGWSAPGGYVFKWIQPTEDLGETEVTLEHWRGYGLLVSRHRVIVEKR